MDLQTPRSAILSAVIFNALIIVGLIPLALRGVKFVPVGAAQLLRRNLLIYGARWCHRAVHRHQAHRHHPHRTGGEVMRRQLLPSVISMVIFTVILGHRVPARGPRHRPARVPRQGRTARSSSATARRWARRSSARPSPTRRANPLPEYFQSRPSAAAGAVGRARRRATTRRCSSGSNLGPTNPDFLKDDHATGEGLPEAQRPLAEHEGAGRRGDRVGLRARPRHLGRQRSAAGARGSPTNGGSPCAKVNQLVDDNTTGRALGILGEKAVNVLELNLALDQLTGNPRPVTP